MNSEDIFKDIINRDSITGNITLGFGAFDEESGEVNYRRLNISDSLNRDFLLIINKFVSHLRREYRDNNLALVEYTGGYKPDQHEVEWVSLNQVEYLLNILQDVPEPADILNYNHEDNRFLKNIRFYVLIVNDGGNDPIYWFRKYNSKRELSKGGKITAILTNNRYDKLQTSGFLFDETIDCIAHRGYAYSFNKNNFQNIFKFYELLREVAEDCLDDIRNNIPIYNFDDFSGCCRSHLFKLVKLRNIANKPYFSSITIDDIKQSVARNNLAVEIIEVDGQEKIKFDPRRQWEILKILDDTYLKSEMTDESYEANSKRRFIPTRSSS